MTSRYDYRTSSSQGEAHSAIDLESGRYRKTQHAGLVSEEEGFDGRQPWTRDLSGFAKSQDGGDIPALATNEAYRNANLWWRPDHGGAQIESISCGGIRITPRGGKSFEAWFDDKTHLLTRVRETKSFASVAETSFADYQQRGGRLIAGRIETIYGGNPTSKETLTLKDVAVTPPRPASDYALPRRNPADWRLPATGRVTLPFRLLNNHVIVDAKIDGRGPFPFLVDTGGHNILSSSVLAALALQSEGSSVSGGAGEKTVTNGYTRVHQVDVGGAVLSDQTVVTLDFSPPDVEGLVLGGMIGVEFLERFVVTFDYGAHTLTLIDPDRFSLDERKSQGVAIPIAYYVHMPQVSGSVDGRAARLNIDTGARDEITLTSPFVARNDLRQAYPGGATTTTGWGVGGPSRSYAVRGGAVSLGPVTVPRPVMGLSAAARGSFSDASYEGNIGGGLLKRFVTTFDYARKVMYLKPLAEPDPDVGSFDRVGMWLNLAPNGLQVMDVLAGGPAEQAGLQVGDLVTKIGDAPFESRSLSDTRRALKLAAVGAPLDITYIRKSAEAVVQVRPRDILPR